MKRYASHYICFQEKELPQDALAVIHRDQKELCSAPTSVLSAYPENTKGFTCCCAEFTDEHKLVRIFPFTEEIESTEWYPGTLQLSELLHT